ncbi:MAG: ATP-dependent helicase [Acidimicrobiia bacterium]
MTPTTEIRIGPEEWPEAIARTDGPQLVVAGPGTGKTEFLVRRVVRLLADGHDPRTLAVLTFSRRGAADLRRRIAERHRRSLGPLSVSTFHSFASRLLEADALGNGTRPHTLLTGPEQVALVAELLGDTDPEGWPLTHRAMLRTRTFAADVADFLMRMAERRIDADRLRQLASDRADWRALPDFAARYRQALTERGRIDYGTLLSHAVDLLRSGVPGMPEGTGWVIVDEYQDTSPAQADLLDALTRSHRNLTVAGDPRQSIYGFRGADLDNIVSFPRRFRSADGSPAIRIVLGTSFRVPAAILEAAERVSAAAASPGDAGPVAPAAHPGSVDVHTFDQASAEAEWIASEAERLHLSERIPYRQMAVLVRSTRNLAPELSRALDRRRIAHDTPDVRLVDHPAVRLVMDLASAAATVSDPDPLAAARADSHIRRVILSPLYGLGVAAEREIRRRRARAGTSWLDALASDPATADLVPLLSDPAWATESSAIDGFWRLWDSLPRLTEFALGANRREHRSAWTAFAQVLEQQHERDPSVTLVDYHRMAESDDFEAIPLLSHRPATDEDRITLTTLHQAKGLEFEVVFIADATEDVFPDLRRGFNPLDPQALGGTADRADWLLDRLREETRLAYTAMTRARTRVVMTATTAGIDETERRPSRFLLLAAGVSSVSELSSPEVGMSDPLTIAGIEAMLRRTLLDPAAPLAHRLAAIHTLSTATPRHWDATRFAGVRRPGPDRGVFSRPPRLSPSQAESYLECPRRYVFERRLAMTDSSNDHARYGTLVHAVLERADLAALADGRPRPRLEDALAALDQLWATEADFGSPWLDDIWKRKAQELLGRLFDEWPGDSDSTVSAERILTWDGGGVEWLGRADRIERVTDGSLRIVDYKTSKSIISQPKAATSLQLGFYVLAAQADPELEGPVGSAELWYPATPQKTMRRTLDMEQVPEIAGILVGVADAVRQELWEPTPGEVCERCSVRIVCPEWPEGREAFVP